MMMMVWSSPAKKLSLFIPLLSCLGYPTALLLAAVKLRLQCCTVEQQSESQVLISNDSRLHLKKEPSNSFLSTHCLLDKDLFISRCNSSTAVLLIKLSTAYKSATAILSRPSMNPVDSTYLDRITTTVMFSTQC